MSQNVTGQILIFHDLAQQTTQGAQTVSAGVSEALIATAVGILVAIPAVVAFNLFQRKTKSALAQAEAEYPGWLSRLLTHPVKGLENYQELFDKLTNPNGAIKVYCEVANG